MQESISLSLIIFSFQLKVDKIIVIPSSQVIRILFRIIVN